MVRRGGGREIEGLIEEALVASREVAPDGSILAHAAWADLDAEARERLFEETLRSRALEAAASEDGRSSTVRSVLARIRGARR